VTKALFLVASKTIDFGTHPAQFFVPTHHWQCRRRGLIGCSSGPCARCGREELTNGIRHFPLLSKVYARYSNAHGKPRVEVRMCAGSAAANYLPTYKCARIEAERHADDLEDSKDG
jgi:hypothetical protein